MRVLENVWLKEGIITYAMDVRGFGEWQKTKQYQEVDLKSALNDLNSILVAIETKYPELPIILAGESMGGAFASHGAALNQDKVAALICSVPSGDRYRGSDDELHIGLNAIFRGFDANINVRQNGGQTCDDGRKAKSPVEERSSCSNGIFS